VKENWLQTGDMNHSQNHFIHMCKADLKDISVREHPWEMLLCEVWSPESSLKLRDETGQPSVPWRWRSLWACIRGKTSLRARMTSIFPSTVTKCTDRNSPKWMDCPSGSYVKPMRCNLETEFLEQPLILCVGFKKELYLEEPSILWILWIQIAMSKIITGLNSFNCIQPFEKLYFSQFFLAEF
jgi:hypothetical protein